MTLNRLKARARVITRFMLVARARVITRFMSVARARVITRFMILPVLVVTLTSVLTIPTESAAATKKGLLKYTYLRCENETVDSVSTLLSVDKKDLIRWNRRSIVKDRRGRQVFKKGVSRVVYYGRKPFTRESVGRPHSGKLIGGMNLDCDGDDRGHGWIISAHRNNMYGTVETIRTIYRAARSYRSYFKGRGLPYVPLAIGDISRLEGGPLPPHVSHQSGRDVDIGVIKKSGNDPGKFKYACSSSMDLLRTWVMMKSFLDTGNVKYIFIHNDLRSRLLKYVKRIYKGRPQYAKYVKLFGGGGVIRGDDEHRSHVHVRFKCPKGDRRCIP